MARNANIAHCKCYKPLLLDTMAHNLKFNKPLKKKFEKDYGKLAYPSYDNYDAIEVPFTNAIPSDYDGVMGVPIDFLDHYDPEQFEIVGALRVAVVGGKRIYGRVLIRYWDDNSVA